MTELVRSDLAACEEVIERGLGTFVQVGEALLRIRDERLYREQHGTFEDYCRERWDFDDSRARQPAAVRRLTPDRLSREPSRLRVLPLCRAESG